MSCRVWCGRRPLGDECLSWDLRERGSLKVLLPPAPGEPRLRQRPGVGEGWLPSSPLLFPAPSSLETFFQNIPQPQSTMGLHRQPEWTLIPRAPLETFSPSASGAFWKLQARMSLREDWPRQGSLPSRQLLLKAGLELPFPRGLLETCVLFPWKILPGVS